MGAIIGALVARGFSERAARAIATIGLAVAALAAVLGAKAIYDQAVISHHEAKQVQKSIKATNQAARERASDAAANAKQEQELHDVIAAQPDQPIAPTSRALACERLRRAGRHPPACR